MNGNAMTYQATCVTIDGRAVVIQGPPGIGKSSLALSLIDRGAVLIGDDSIVLEVEADRVIARPHPNTRELLEVRNLGLLRFPCAEAQPVALVIGLDPAAPRYIEVPRSLVLCGTQLPFIELRPEGATLALKAELALRHYGLSQ
ncbi:HPr kinase/phosphorylase [Novosphingobium sp. AP12]|uniref:HPr kinase/phosphorylase n=1 Tax=Novosphingobium sp. AP12 TaxID=1144305 RepID=UPI000271E6CB|nr:HPr kinase/phosphatase C-terminal domain-containing protein [Novosphingobium sp. AP12]EJL35256.1 serine kinase of the HPr protein, regulates carbohydrate metabolism [Novosphingobium sp. AP12]